MELTIPLPSAAEKALTAVPLNELAWPLVDPDETKRTWGDEARGLMLARLAWEGAAGMSPKERAQIGDTLAWAWFANGKDAEAIAQSKVGVSLVDPGERADFEGYLASLQAEIRGAAGVPALAELRVAVAALEADVTSQRTFRFAAASQTFLYETLRELRGKLQGLDDNERAGVAQRLGWAQRIEDLTRRHPLANVTWESARAAIARADGVVASELYRGGPTISLSDEDVVGLVPIGMNPVTRLWEFYDLRSAWDGSADPATIEIPRHVEVGERRGAIEVHEHTGIVFVLLPGARFTMGRQGTDPKAPYYDRMAERDDTVHTMTLAPFFLARHELTKAQWRRLSGGGTPSYYVPGFTTAGGPRITWSNPVESVDWWTCVSVLTRHALQLPTEAQWEYGCRAGTTSPWACEPEDLPAFANVADRTAKDAGQSWECETWSDGHIVHAPVGSFRANGFGMFDMHGNVTEWTADGEFGPTARPRDGDGLRGNPADSRARVHRGGSFNVTARHVRSAGRSWVSPSHQVGDTGFRVARSLKP